jgi:hypothetical protein
VTDLNLTIPDLVFDAAAALRQDAFYILRPQSSTVSGVTTPGVTAQIGPYLGEFWMVSGDELAPNIAESPGNGRLATALTLTIQTTDQIGVGGKLYDVGWVPEPSGLDLTRVVYLRETGLDFPPDGLVAGSPLLDDGGNLLLGG